MPIVTTRAVVLQTHRYSDTSKIVRLMTRDHGPRSAIARGVLRPRSRISGLLEPFSEGSVTLYLKSNRDLHTLSDFELLRERQALGADLRKYGGASVLCELVLRLAPEEGDARLFGFLSDGLDALLAAGPADVVAVALGAAWRIVAALGFLPVLDRCVRCGSPIGEVHAAFDFGAGGLVCGGCVSGRERLRSDELAVLRRLAAGIPAPGPVGPRQIALLSDFVRYHAAEGSRLRSLDFFARRQDP